MPLPTLVRLDELGPLERELVDGGIRAEVGGDAGQPLAVEQLERLGLHLREGGGGAGGAVDDQLQDFAGFGQVGAALQVLVASLFLGLLSRFGDKGGDVVHQGGEGVVVEAVKAVDDEAEQVEVGEPAVELLEAMGRVVVRQRGVVGDGIGRDLQLWDDAHGEVVERTKGV
ncbi:MAG: hypothetical protein HC828_17090, partial [Blastochloris sp.]|nr:hypothetical protein [Blastochloris sp.]